MRITENQCCDCASPGYPCLGSSCPRRNAEVVVCDDCNESECDIYEYDGKELCLDCIAERLYKVN